MQAVSDRFDFAPPAPAGLFQSLILAVLAHSLLIAALTWGVQWHQDAPVTSAEAELWSAVPQEAAPKPVEAPPEQSARPQPEVTAPKPVKPPEIDIALEQLRLKKKQQLEVDQEKLRQEKLKEDKLKQEKADKADMLKKKKAEAQTKKLEVQRQDNLKRMAGLAGASGAPSSSGTALKSTGPSANYAGRIRARIRPNIVFIENLTTNPTTEVEVRTASDGTIIGRKIIKSSANKSWDDAVIKAIDKTEVLPRDTDGRVPSPLVISFRPKD